MVIEIGGKKLQGIDMLQLRKSYIEIGKLVQRNGYGQYNGILNILMGQIKCIDSKENIEEKIQYLTDGYSRIFLTRGSLGDFVIYDENLEVRNQLNVKYNEEVKKIWEIMKQYI